MTKSQHSQTVDVHNYIDIRFKNILKPFVRGHVSSEAAIPLLGVPADSPERERLRHSASTRLPGSWF